MEYGRLDWNLTVQWLNMLGDCMDIFPSYCLSVLTLTFFTNSNLKTIILGFLNSKFLVNYGL